MTRRLGGGRSRVVDGEPRRRGRLHVEKAWRCLGKLENGLSMLLVQLIGPRCLEAPALLEAAVPAGGEEEGSIRELLWIKG